MNWLKVIVVGRKFNEKRYQKIIIKKVYRAGLSAPKHSIYNDSKPFVEHYYYYV